tara:strand:- start:1828 stop:2103 length:276 start_codon:yes stop_codon:yes gene_type:complete
MAITAEGLQQLGFTPEVDFSLQDDGDGTYIREWLSASPQPSVDEIEEAEPLWASTVEAEAAQKAADKESANQKLRDLGLTDTEIDALVGGA